MNLPRRTDLFDPVQHNRKL